MRNILVGECKQEISSFNPVLSHYEDFNIMRGTDILDFHRGGIAEMAGALSAFDAEKDLRVLPTYSARARTSAGTLATPDMQRIMDELFDEVRAAADAAPRIDGVYLSLHGAMAAVDEPDPEGYLLRRMRGILGEEMPIVVSLDLHAILTDEMLRQADAVVCFHTYPHQDFFLTGQRAARALMAILDDGARPATARVAIPALVRGNELITETGLLGTFVRQAQEAESLDECLSAGMIIGNPFTDVPELGSSAFVTVDTNKTVVSKAEERALEMARGFWHVRERLQAPLVDLDEAVRIASSEPGTTILTDAADATSSGAPGDSNAILAALVRHGFQRPALAPIIDAPAVHVAQQAGIGAQIEVRLGGTLDPRHEPLAVTAEVRMLSDGRYQGEHLGTPVDAGPCAVLQAGTITIVVASRPVGFTDRSIFFAHGLDPRHFDAIVVKSPHCRREYFDDWAARDLNVDAPGATSANLRSLGHKVVRRPIFPLDKDVAFDPRVQVFSRHGV